MVARLFKKKLVAKQTYEFFFKTEKDLVFSPGQYVTITIVKPKHEDYQMNQRIFSLVNSPAQKRIATILFRYRESGFKKNLLGMAMGGRVQIDKPTGIFCLPTDKTIPLVFLASGVGISPFMSTLENMKQTNDSKRKIIMFFSNRTVSEAPYLTELEKLSKTLINFQLVKVFTRETIPNTESKRTTLGMIKENVSEFARANFFLAGQPEFVEDLVRQLLADGVPKEKITQESFDGY